MFESLTVALDVEKTQGSALAVKSGIEYWTKDVLAFRLGYDSAYDLGTGLGFGFGFKAVGVQVDYAFSDVGGLGGTHHVGISYRFGSVAESHYQNGMRYLRLGDFAKAIIEFNRALSVDHSHRRAILRIKEANERLQSRLDQLKQ